MLIVRDSSIEKFVLDSIRTLWGKTPRTGIHLSDLISPRRAYWERVKPLPATDKEIQYWLIGRGHEEALHEASGFRHGVEQEVEGIVFTPDFFHNFPDESKTRRGYLAKPGEETIKYDYYLKQLRGYCALTGSSQGWLRVWSLMEKQDDFSTAPEFAAYRVEFTIGELTKELQNLIVTRASLVEALRQGNHKLLSQCPEWMCGKVQRKTTIKSFCQDCNKDFTFPERHLKSKPHHSIAPAEYSYTYRKDCKWFVDCQPNLSWKAVEKKRQYKIEVEK
jgi:hypothetical protein